MEFTEGQIISRKSRTPFADILLFYLKIPGNPFVFVEILYSMFSELPHGID